MRVGASTRAGSCRFPNEDESFGQSRELFPEAVAREWCLLSELLSLFEWDFEWDFEGELLPERELLLFQWGCSMEPERRRNRAVAMAGVLF